MKSLSNQRRGQLAIWYVYAQIAVGMAALVCGFQRWESHDLLRLVSFLAVAALGSLLKVRLPGVTGAVSVSALFVLVGIVNLSLPEALLVGLSAMLVQCTWRTTSRPRAIQVAFNLCVVSTSIFLSSHLFFDTRGYVAEPVGLALLAISYFFANTFPVASIIGLTEKKSILKVWREYCWMLPYYVGGSSIGWLIATVPASIQWELPIIALPLVYLVHRSNQTHITQIEQQNRHVLEMNSLHLRTIEALALAIDAKDHATHDHLQRVQLYALEIGKDLGLEEEELDALRAAAILHDIGKLAVPESIISKPGKLTRGEFEKMKIHPVVGAEILERVNFPYPVAPIVRAHHERWDGSGYPYGLQGTEIPIGARILSVVDCLDALASDRQYRRALSLDEAMARVAAESGTSFDPDVVHALQLRYQELEAQAKAAGAECKPLLSVDLKITRGSAPAAGFETEAPVRANRAVVIHPVARERNRGASDNWTPIQAHEALAVAAMRIDAAIPYDAVAFYTCHEGALSAAFATGEDRRTLSSMLVPEGEGLVGWVAENAKPILNGNPNVEPGYPADGPLGSALALPLQDGGRVLGVMALYRKEKDAFGADELVSLLSHSTAITSLFLDMEFAAEGAQQISSDQPLALSA